MLRLIHDFIHFFIIAAIINVYIIDFVPYINSLVNLPQDQFMLLYLGRVDNDRLIEKNLIPGCTINSVGVSDDFQRTYQPGVMLLRLMNYHSYCRDYLIPVIAKSNCMDS
jgi:hypothetical protein